MHVALYCDLNFQGLVIPLAMWYDLLEIPVVLHVPVIDKPYDHQYTYMYIYIN